MATVDYTLDFFIISRDHDFDFEMKGAEVWKLYEKQKQICDKFNLSYQIILKIRV